MASVSNSRIASISSGKFPTDVLRNAAPARLYQDAVMYDEAQITSSGGLATTSGEKTGRSPGDKRVVDQESVHDDVCLLCTSPSPRDQRGSRMPSSA